jgi:formylglycine-generating enzyme required for sulfatase activity
MSRWLALAVLLLASAAHAQTPWEGRQYNPQPRDDDVVLPMPCGGRMAFRRIDTPTGPNPLDDRAVTLGLGDTDADYSEWIRQDFVAGPFADRQRKTRYYLLGKYEVTQDQLDAVMKEACPEASTQGRLPATGLSWYDAVEFTRRYTEWLLKNAGAALPGEGEAKGFVRLPTEAEWEFAARGGSAVSDLDFRAKTFPMPDGTAKYAWFQGAKSAAGQIRPIGLLQPNPLGLHDMLGNAAEMVLEPYRLNKVGRLQGQPGGVTAKGGDFRTPEDRLRSALRVEYAPFDAATGQPLKLPTLGLRVALGAAATGSLQHTAELHKAFEELSRSRAPGADPVETVKRIAREAPDPLTQESLGQVAEALQAERRARLDQQKQTVKVQLEAASLLLRSVREQDQRLRVLRDIVKSTPDVPANAARLREYRDTLATNERVLDVTLDSFARLVADLVPTPDAVLDEQLTVLRNENENRGTPLFSRSDAKAVAELRKLRANPNIPRDTLLADLVRD